MSLRTLVGGWFRAQPIRRKVRVGFISAIALGLLLAGVGIITADSVEFFRFIRRDLLTFVGVIGDNCTAALAFGDPKVASETLSALRLRTHVKIACLYTTSGEVLATYRRQGDQDACPPYDGEQIRRTDGNLFVSHQIFLDGSFEGSLVLLYDLQEATDRIQFFGATVLAALLLACLVAVGLSSGVRASIAEPILALAYAAEDVSRSKDYSIRAKKHSVDEIGMLADAFNQMLESIQSRDTDLRKALEEQQLILARLGQVNADLQRSNVELERSNHDLERFAFVASHDLQEPLRMVTIYTQRLVAEYPPGDPSTSYISQIVGGARRMRELLADLLAYTEIAGSSEQPTESVDLNHVLQQVLFTLNSRIEESGAVVSSVDLPTLIAHEGRLMSLFLNLIGNAIKYRSAETPRVHISADRNDELTFAVSDNGIGIAPEYQEKIFVAFQRLHGREKPGTGIGLAICQRIIENYNGRIWVESKPGQGSTFRFTLPAEMAAQWNQKTSGSGS